MRYATITLILVDASRVRDGIEPKQASDTDNDARLTTLQAELADANARIAALQQCVMGLAQRLAAVESNTVLRLDGVLSHKQIDGRETALFEGVNVQIVNGSKTTIGVSNGVGNLIVGYNEAPGSAPFDASVDRGGSHNIVIGPAHRFSNVGGLVAGSANTVSGAMASVTGGRGNIASGAGATIGGGLGNTADGDASSIGGGKDNIASGLAASVVGGESNTANGRSASVGGGFGNTASGVAASVAGGLNRGANGQFHWRAGRLQEEQ